MSLTSATNLYGIPLNTIGRVIGTQNDARYSKAGEKRLAQIYTSLCVFARHGHGQQITHRIREWSFLTLLEETAPNALK